MQVTSVDDTLERIAHYEAAASATFVPLRVEPVDPDTFDGAMRAVRVGRLVVAQIAAQPGTVYRGPARMTSSDPELIKVAWHGTGRVGIAQDGRQCLPDTGDLVAYETTRPYELPSWEPYRTVVVGVPRPMLGPHAKLVSERTATPVTANHGIPRLAASFFRDVAGNVPGNVAGVADSAESPAAHHLADALVSLIVAAFTEAAAETVELGSPLLDRILAYCRAHLTDPALSVESVAAAHGISARYLHKLCQSAGVRLSAWIRRERLERIRRDLSDPALADRTTAAIAARWGIMDAGHLGRALRAEFGQTAVEIRHDATHM